MGLIYKLATPITVGDLNSSRTVSTLQLSSISINYEPVYANNGTAILSICMIDPESGYPVNYVYQDASALDMAKTIEAQIGSELFAKLSADGKLPAGAVALTSADSTTASTDATTTPAPVS